LGRAFQHHHARTALLRRDCGEKAGCATTDDDHVKYGICHTQFPGD
jgi:hypothetical protein